MFNKLLTKNISKLKGKNITNQMSWGNMMTSMTHALELMEQRVKNYGHCDPKSYAK